MAGTTKCSSGTVRLVLISSILALSLAIAACGSGVSQDQFDAAVQNLQTQSAKLQSIESELGAERASAADLQRSAQEL
jgi:outer membrane murein-binding lipoprotein Lpp